MTALVRYNCVYCHNRQFASTYPSRRTLGQVQDCHHNLVLGQGQKAFRPDDLISELDPSDTLFLIRTDRGENHGKNVFREQKRTSPAPKTKSILLMIRRIMISNTGNKKSNLDEEPFITGRLWLCEEKLLALRGDLSKLGMHFS